MINLLLSCNKNYLTPSKTMLFSLCRKLTPQEKVTVHFLNTSLSEQDLNELRSFLDIKCKADLKTYNVDWECFKEFPVDRISYEAYLRIISQFVLPQNLDRILWLDGDIIILKDISEFYHQDFENNCFVVCPDLWNGTEFNNRLKEKLKMAKDSHYFNTGVMLMNLDMLRQETSMNSIVNKCNAIKENIIFHDQDLLNHIYFNKVKLNDWRKYNCQRSGKPKEMNIDYDGVVILHYTGVRKPWDYKFLDKLSKYYWREYILSSGLNGFLKATVFYIKGSVFKSIEMPIKWLSPNLYDKIKKLLWKV